MPAGRPTGYNDDIQSKADYYLDNWADIGDKVPSRVGLCCYIGIHKSTSYDWEQEHRQFSDTLKKIEAAQESVALNGGISGLFNSTITKLVLANHGYSERSAIDHQSTDGSMTPHVIERTVVDPKATDKDT